MTPRERALKKFKKRWKADMESDGEELPIQKQLENAWKLGWEALGKELKEWADNKYAPDGYTWQCLMDVIAKCDELMKEKS
jgi:hypothetical protein